MSDLYDQAFNQLAAVIDKAAGQGEETLAEGLHDHEHQPITTR